MAKGKVFDPFTPPYNPNLYVGEIKDEESQEEFIILVRKVMSFIEWLQPTRLGNFWQLNKFSVVAHHFLMVTKGECFWELWSRYDPHAHCLIRWPIIVVLEFKSQASPLSPGELVQAYSFLSAARKLGKQYFAFYNCMCSAGQQAILKHPFLCVFLIRWR